MTGFAAIRKRAEGREGGAAALATLLPAVAPPGALLALTDDRALAEMSKRIFCSGFVWRVIEAKWAGFEAAFLGFDVARLCFEPDEFWEALGRDTWMTSRDMIACLRDAGVEIGEGAISRRELRLVQGQLNAWAAETGLPLSHLSRICAMSIGENSAAEG